MCCTYSGHVRYVHYTNVVLLLEHIAHLHCDVTCNIYLCLVLKTHRAVMGVWRGENDACDEDDVSDGEKGDNSNID